MNPDTAEHAYTHCRDVTRASATSFYYGMRLLPRPRRVALYAVYAFARRIDDIADGSAPAAEKLAALGQARDELATLEAQNSDPVLVALADACWRYRLPREALGELIDGATMDVSGRSYETFDDLVVYCRHVGGTIGRLSLAVFGSTDKGPQAMALADDLGVAFQLTNILRDVREDRDDGRIYLPREDLDRFGCSLEPGGSVGRFAELVRFEAERAEQWYDRGLELVSLLDRPSASCVAAMAGIYRRLLRRIEREPATVLDGRLSLPGWEKGWVAARSLVGAGT
jgi:15-cis-phytoene synthase